MGCVIGESGRIEDESGLNVSKCGMQLIHGNEMHQRMTVLVVGLVGREMQVMTEG